MYKCEFCSKELSSKNNLKTHQVSTKSCLKLQQELNSNLKIHIDICQYCKKEFQYKQTKDRHEVVCKEKVISLQVLSKTSDIKSSYENEIVNLKTQHLDEISDINSGYEKEISDLKIRHLEEISILKDEISNLKTRQILKDEIATLKIETYKIKENNDIIFVKDREIICDICKNIFIKDLYNVCNDCQTNRKLPCKNDRIIGEMYIKDYRVVIWTGKRLNCFHNKIRNQCVQCKGSSICIHNKIKTGCKDCKGSSFCIHDKQKNSCLDCFTHPQNFCSLCKSVFTKGCPYHPLCYRCYCYTNPSEEIPSRFKMKENYINDYIMKKLPQYKIINDKSVSGGCSRKRPDWLIDMLTHSVIIENDENSHKNYSCENKRMMELFIDLGSRPLIMIRFNCDKYSNQPSCFEFDEKNTIQPTREWNVRRDTLIQSIVTNCETIPNKEISIEYLFYDDTLQN